MYLNSNINLIKLGLLWNLLKNIVQKNPNFKLHECEMVLFAQAEELCTKVMI